jgi:hypothetical protein
LRVNRANPKRVYETKLGGPEITTQSLIKNTKHKSITTNITKENKKQNTQKGKKNRAEKTKSQ